MRYTTREQWHVTLLFLGTVPIEPALDAFAQIDGEECEALLGPAVSRLGRSVVVLPCAGLDALAASVVAAMGEGPEPRPFVGHLTLARLVHRGACRVAGQRVAARFEVREVALVRSRLGGDGARYETLAVRALTPRG